MSDSLASSIQSFAADSGTLVLLEIPEFGVDAQELAFKSVLLDDPSWSDFRLPQGKMLELHKDGQKFMKHLTGNLDRIEVLSVIDILCQNGNCSPFDADGKPMFTDTIHPSSRLAEKIGSNLLKQISK